MVWPILLPVFARAEAAQAEPRWTGAAIAWVVPLVALICVGCPVFASWEVPLALTALRGNKALAALRESLDQLPGVEHPLGL